MSTDTTFKTSMAQTWMFYQQTIMEFHPNLVDVPNGLSIHRDRFANFFPTANITSMAKKLHKTENDLAEITSPDGKPVMAYATPKQFATWLHKHHTEHQGVWIQFFKVASGYPSITYAQALDVALSFGWIDGPVRKGNEASWIHKFTPRGKRSIWSQVNKQHIERLKREGLMQPAGIAAVELAKADGRWDAAYASSSTFEESVEFIAALRKSPKARDFYATLTRANRYAFYFRIHNVKKEETKRKKIAEFIAMLERGETFH